MSSSIYGRYPRGSVLSRQTPKTNQSCNRDPSSMYETRSVSVFSVGPTDGGD